MKFFIFSRRKVNCMRVTVYKKGSGMGQIPQSIDGDSFSVTADGRFLQIVNVKDVKGAATGVVRYIPIAEIEQFDVK
jgi:hypothetical protein